MGESIMTAQDIRFETWSIKWFTQFEQVAYKAIFERGMVDVDFNKQHWNLHLKNLLALQNNICRLLVHKDQIVGFYILQLHDLPWNHRTHALFTLLHIIPEYRSLTLFQAMMRDSQAIAKANNVVSIQTSDKAFILPENDKLTLLQNAGFDQIEMVWETKYQS